MGIFEKEFIVGLDIGDSSIKIAQFRKKEDGLYLIKADLREIRQFEDINLREQEVVSILKDLFKGIEIKKSKIIVVINCPKTAIKIAKVPYMPKAELRNGISLEQRSFSILHR
jgi:Tfp pilus assembly PilM family ATPase